MILWKKQIKTLKSCCIMHEFSFFFILVQFSWNYFDKLSLTDNQLLFDSVSLFDRLIVCPKYQLFDLLLCQILLKVFDDFGEAFFWDNFWIFFLIHKKLVGFLNIFCTVLLTHFYYHNLQELLEIYLCFVKFCVLFSRSQVPDQITDLLIAGIKA